MYAVTSMPLVRRTRATFRSAEFGFFGVVVYTRVQTPRRWGEPFNAGVFVFSTLSSRPLRTSWLIVGMGGLDLLPALGWCCLGGACWSCSGAGPTRPRPRATVRPPRSGVSPSPGPADEVGPESVAPRDSAPPPTGMNREVVPVGREGHPGAPRTGAGPGHPGHG